MKTKVITTDDFEKSAKPLLKRYASLKSELQKLSNDLKENPTLGVSLGSGVYKIRLAIKSKGKGKSGGARVITYFDLEVLVETETKEEYNRVFLLEIYDKSETDSISAKDIEKLTNRRFD
ncbi:type II toxin-antitoxin system RelE/ParE family toxin [Arcicella sp. LKC2W]|uniref:type II toxin-antitoxin system RelE/ParE family toxin n=1 Tax=Arcicella sp. LKC2W TaxID=2984198 RepID=UPI002B1FFC6D|nr:type II toxin-antitoxin system RelE/ParE family toxin [Arcicella sp. LKC2W]MEA5457499.1 type II toxin-antitoxin system RelE/ParE family toxin [Arcicella sp. LKC2W]